MIFDKTQFFMIQAHGGKFKKNTLLSFINTFKKVKIEEINIFKEKKSREHTLNSILKNRDKEKNIFIFVDDIIFLNGWHKSLNKNAKDGTIVGFSMLKADGKLIQDFGYDLIELDDSLSSKALYRDELLTKKKLPPFRQCSAVCGCAMWISKTVLNEVKKFPLEGKNRWGEMIYSNLARRKGFKTIVLSSHLIHLGTSTKLNKDPLLSSNSWLIEKDMWNKISLKFLKDAPISKKLKSRFSPQFIDLIKNSKKLLIYGCGTVSNYISKNFITNKTKIDYVSTLSEEIGQKFYNKTIKDLNKINFVDYDRIFISAIGYEKKIIDKIPEETRHKIITIKKSVKKNNINFEICNYKSLSNF